MKQRISNMFSKRKIAIAKSQSQNRLYGDLCTLGPSTTQECDVYKGVLIPPWVPIISLAF